MPPGSPESVVRAARYGFPMTLAIIGSNPLRFRPYVELYHRALAQFGHDPLPVGVHSPGHIAATDAAAREELWPAYQVMRNRIGAERGWGPTSRTEFEHEIAEGSLYVGSPETVARKIAHRGGTRRVPLRSQVQRRHARPRSDAPEHRAFGCEVMPRVRQLVSEAAVSAKGTVATSAA